MVEAQAAAAHNHPFGAGQSAFRAAMLRVAAGGCYGVKACRRAGRSSLRFMGGLRRRMVAATGPRSGMTPWCPPANRAYWRRRKNESPPPEDGEGISGNPLDHFNLRMKTNRTAHLIAAAFGLAAVSVTASAADEKVASAPVRPSLAIVTMAITGPVSETVAVRPAATAGPIVAPTSWNDIKDCTFDLRAQLFAGLTQLEARVDDQIRELVAKRATMKGETGTKDWDFAMKEMREARSYLQSMGTELSKATRETWDEAKAKVGEAWVKTQEAYGNVKSSTTS